MICCNLQMKKKGKTLKGIQRHLCKQCGSTKQEEYRN
ncbi:IS1/IS1595 family N-terminal zinc-binding domain-containing protein, partial [Wandonia haliotis]